MAIIVKTKTKKQEKIIKAFLESHDIDFIKVEEEKVPYETRRSKSSGKKEILDDIEKSVEFVNKYKKGKAQLIPAFFNGLRSNLKAMGDVRKCSSVIYIIGK